MKTYHRMLRISTAALAVLPASIHAQEKNLSTPPDADVFGYAKPAWITDLTLGVKEGFDNNLLGVSGYGLRPKGSAFTTLSPRIGFDFAPLLGDQKTLQTLTFNYSPDCSIYYNAPQENYSKPGPNGPLPPPGV